MDSHQTSLRDFLGKGAKINAIKKRRGVARKVGALFGIFATILIASILLVIPPLMIASGVIMAAEPAVETWKIIPTELPKIVIAGRSTFFDKNGAPFATVWTEDRTSVKSLDDISEYAKKGLINTEDKRFYEHNGLDIQGTLRAAATSRGGGSGVTQQVVKNLQFYNLIGKESSKELATERTYVRKLRELKLSIEYEKEHSKDEILLTYFNTVAFGSPNLYGIETASNYFFDKSAKDLSLAQASALVGTAQSPVEYDMRELSTYNDWKERQSIVLDRMVAENTITKTEAKKAKKTDLKFVKKDNPSGNCQSSKYPFYCKYVLDYITKSPKLGETQEERDAILARGGLEVTTYLDPKAMEVSERLLREGYGMENRVIAPTAIVQPGTGGVLAIAQNRDWGEDNAGPGHTTLITPDIPAAEGSVYKIFTLAAAFNNGYDENLTMSSDCPLFPGPDYDVPAGGFKNSNSCELQGGELNFKEAIAWSSNTWFVTLEKTIGVEAVKEFSRSVGLAAPEEIGPRSLSYTLGVVGNPPIDVAAATATFANKGVYCPPTPVQEISYENGSQPPLPDSYDPTAEECRPVMSPKAAGLVLQAMRANISGEISGAFGLAANIPGYDTAGKSGTNQDLNIAWIQVSAQYSIYTNTYDMVKPTNGIRGAIFRGQSAGGNTAQITVSDILRELLKNEENIPLLFESDDDTFQDVRVNNSDYITVPSVLGLPPEHALDIMKGLGITTNISKTSHEVPKGYHEGVVVEQSVKSGEKLTKGTTREIILYLGKK